MGYKRASAPSDVLQSDALTSAMAGIGMAFAAEPNYEANIEDTIYFASLEGMDRDDLRTLSVLTMWLSVFSRWINADRLVRVLQSQECSVRVRCFWASFSRWMEKDRRFGRLSKLYTGPRIDLLSAGTDFLVRRFGEDLRFQHGPLRVPANTLRIRESDVLTPAELARHHRVFKHRVMMGPSYRADLWASLEQDPSLSVAALARRGHASFATAWQVKQESDILADSVARKLPPSR